MATPLAFKLIFSGDVEQTVVVSRLAPVTIGRGGDVVLTDPKASRVNCRIALTDRGLEIEDLKSLNGTLVNGERLVRGPLEDGDIIRIGDCVIHVHVDHAEVATSKATVLRPAFSSHLIGDEEDTVGGLSAQPRGLDPVAKTLEAEGFSDLSPLAADPPSYVYNATRTVLEQPVTLRVLDASAAARVQAERFLREAKVAARLNHPNVVRLFDARMAGKYLYMILERLTGRTLLDEIDPEHPMQPERALQVALPIVRAIVYAHKEGVIHRDLRPVNITIDDEGQGKLIGFGLAKQKPREGRGAKKLTRVREAIGTAGYAAPEQLQSGADANELSDVFGLGATLFHALTGRTALPADAAPGAEPPPVQEVRPDLPPRLAVLINRCLRPKPEERFWGARELLHSIEATIRDLYGFRDGGANVDLLVRYAQPVEDAAEPLVDVTASGELDAFPSPGAAPAPAELPSRAGGKRAGPPVFLGSFAENELIELVQMVEINRKSGFLEVVSEEGNGAGRLVLHDGCVIQARFKPGGRGEREKGRDALIRILTLSGGRFRLTVKDPEVKPEHRLPIGPLLLEVMRMRDEMLLDVGEDTHVV